MNRNTEKFCPMCEKAKSVSQFHKSPLLGGGYLHYCKTCCLSRYRELVKIIGNDKAALWCLLAELGIPAKKEVMAQVDKISALGVSKGRKVELFLTYLRSFTELGIAANGFWESDIMLTAYYGRGEGTEEQEEEQEFNASEEIMKWGRYERDGKLDEEAYKYLNKTFEDYTMPLPAMNANLINRYRDLCKAEWRKRKADESGDIQEIAKAQDNLEKLLKLLKLNEFQSNKKSETELFIARKSWMIENTKPSECEDLNKYKDFSGFGPIWEDIMRTVGNAVAGTRNYPKLPKEAITGGDK